MALEFYKYQGTGNDFIIIDNRHLSFDKNDTKQISRLCDRRFGIGADGLILLENHDSLDFKMVYYNSDGRESSMCGNGGRCITAFAKAMGIIEDVATFEAIDGIHKAEINGNQVRLQMKDVDTIKILDDHLFIDTGSPHVVKQEDDVETLDVKNKGGSIRRSDVYLHEGVNVNFIEQLDGNTFMVRTYERGVEDETLSCGTGVTAAAIYTYNQKLIDSNKVDIITKGGKLQVTFNTIGGRFENIWLIGPAVMVFKGELK